MRIRLLCVGDVVGSPGRRAIANLVPELITSADVGCTIVNAENVASGSGITPNLYDKLIKSGVNLITLGDHIYRRREIIPVLESSSQIVRPANLPPTAPGREFAIFETSSGYAVAIVSLLGRLYMKTQVDCPFRAVERVLAKIPDHVRVVVVDMHAEATSEKIAMGWFLDGKVSLLFGTHTHVPTADERILPGGTGYITDVGMTGPYDSILGRQKESVLQALVTAVPTRFDVAEHDVRLSGIVADIDTETGHCISIERVCLPERAPAAP
jgi:metallophosphoesterase (TIGR00282 family)